jgi:hypothetical protein
VLVIVIVIGIGREGEAPSALGGIHQKIEDEHEDDWEKVG